MHLIDPADHLRLLAQDRERRLLHTKRLRIARARDELARHERRAEQAWLDLVRALGDVGDARRALVGIDGE